MEYKSEESPLVDSKTAENKDANLQTSTFTIPMPTSDEEQTKPLIDFKRPTTCAPKKIKFDVRLTKLDKRKRKLFEYNWPLEKKESSSGQGWDNEKEGIIAVKVTNKNQNNENCETVNESESKLNKCCYNSNHKGNCRCKSSK